MGKIKYNDLTLEKINNDITFLNEHIDNLERHKWDGFMFSTWTDSEFIEDMGDGLTVLSAFTILPFALLSFANPFFLLFGVPTALLIQYTYNPIPELISASKAPFERLEIFNLKRKRNKFIKARQEKIDQDKIMEELLFENTTEPTPKFSSKKPLTERTQEIQQEV